MYLLDTNVLSELRKLGSKSIAPAVAKWTARQQASDFFLSAITVMEIEIGVQRLERHAPGDGARLRLWVDEQIGTTFADRILPVDVAVVLRCATLHVPRTQPLKDSLIAATALVHNMTVVTRNVSDFAATGVRLLNPWDARS